MSNLVLTYLQTESQLCITCTHDGKYHGYMAVSSLPGAKMVIFGSPGPAPVTGAACEVFLAQYLWELLSSCGARRCGHAFGVGRNLAVGRPVGRVASRPACWPAIQSKLAGWPTDQPAGRLANQLASRPAIPLASRLAARPAGWPASRPIGRVAGQRPATKITARNAKCKLLLPLVETRMLQHALFSATSNARTMMSSGCPFKRLFEFPRRLRRYQPR